MIDETLLDAEEKMEKAVSVAKEDLSSVRTGRAHPGMFSRIVVEYYGAPTPLNQMASVNVPEARMALIKPYDQTQLNAIEKAIRNSDLGVNPASDGTSIRVVLPELTEERRKEYIKMAKGKAEDARIAVRNIRRHANDQLKKLQKDGEISEDDLVRAEKALDGTTKRFVESVDEVLKTKEAELAEV